jgi:hypothetical protein
VLIKDKIDFQQPFFMENDRIAAWHIWILGSKEMEKWTGLSRIPNFNVRKKSFNVEILLQITQDKRKP